MSAGAVHPTDPALERWQRVVATNLTGVFLICRAALPQLIETSGAIVTIRLRIPVIVVVRRAHSRSPCR